MPWRGAYPYDENIISCAYSFLYLCGRGIHNKHSERNSTRRIRPCRAEVGICILVAGTNVIASRLVAVSNDIEYV